MYTVYSVQTNLYIYIYTWDIKCRHPTMSLAHFSIYSLWPGIGLTILNTKVPIYEHFYRDLISYNSFKYDKRNPDNSIIPFFKIIIRPSLLMNFSYKNLFMNYTLSFARIGNIFEQDRNVSLLILHLNLRKA